MLVLELKPYIHEKNNTTKNTAVKKAWETPAIFTLDTKATEGKTWNSAFEWMSYTGPS